MSTTDSVLCIRDLDGLNFAITIRTQYTPGWLMAKLGKVPTATDCVYIGNHVWREATTGVRVDYWYAKWLQEIKDGRKSVQLYSKYIEDKQKEEE